MRSRFNILIDSDAWELGRIWLEDDDNNTLVSFWINEGTLRVYIPTENHRRYAEQFLEEIREAIKTAHVEESDEE